jgi:NitT/TauT family transport system substrate-binding protein
MKKFIQSLNIINLCLTNIIVITGLSLPVGAATQTLKVGVLKYGTVNWEMDVIKHRQLDQAFDINIEVIPYASKQATLVAFHSGAVDVIVADWIWVSIQRHNQKNYSFIPYSTALGAVMVPAHSDITTLSALKGKQLGVAGGALDKSWLMLQTLSKAKYNFDMSQHLTTQYAAPPLLNGQLQHNKIDAVLNFWHYCARLEAEGYRSIHSMRTTVNELLGYDVQLPMLGYVFKTPTQDTSIEMYKKFSQISLSAHQIMLNNDQEWQRLKPLMKVSDETTFIVLRDRYREGIPQKWGNFERASANVIYSILAQHGGQQLVGDHPHLAAGTFWSHVEY